jgi:hypothetical protein
VTAAAMHPSLAVRTFKICRDQFSFGRDVVWHGCAFSDSVDKLDVAAAGVLAVPIVAFVVAPACAIKLVYGFGFLRVPRRGMTRSAPISMNRRRARIRPCNKQVRSGMYALYSCHSPAKFGCTQGSVAVGPAYASCP